jgi:dTDP-4-amino-4,6-dideoxygalactose transaminase
LRSHGINKLDDPLQVPNQAFTNGELNPWYYEMQELGFHYRITDLQCALALSQFKKIENFIDRRRQLVKQYDEFFLSTNHCRPAQNVGRDQSAHHIYILKINFASIGLHRGEFMRQLKARGIGSQVHYIPVPSQPYYQKLGFQIQEYPNAQKYYQQALSIPLFYSLSDEQQEHVVSTIKEVLK